MSQAPQQSSSSGEQEEETPDMHKGMVDFSGSGAAVRPYTITDSEDGQPQVLVVNDAQLIADAN